MLLALATPIALANSETFRSKVLQLLMEFDNEKGEAYFSFVPDDSAGFEVPVDEALRIARSVRQIVK